MLVLSTLMLEEPYDSKCLEKSIRRGVRGLLGLGPLADSDESSRSCTLEKKKQSILTIFVKHSFF